MKKIGDFWVPRKDVRTARNRRKVEGMFLGKAGTVEPIQSAIAIVRQQHPDLDLSRMTAIDAGANVGSYTRVLAQVFGRVVSLEPAPDTYACLERNVYEWGLLPKVHHYMAAVTDERGYVGMGRGWGRLSITSRIRGTGDIPAIPLDALGLADVALLKLDVEGYEEQALIGARELIAMSRPFILMEVKETEPGDPLAAHRRLLSLGYEDIDRTGINWLYRHAG